MARTAVLLLALLMWWILMPWVGLGKRRVHRVLMFVLEMVRAGLIRGRRRRRRMRLQHKKLVLLLVVLLR